MKILLLADPFSAHVIKWANGLSRKGVDVSIFGLSEYNDSEYDKNINISIFKVPQYIKWRRDGSFLKSAYILSLPRLKKIINKIKPDIIHAHSASSYGMLGALSRFHPYIISVWGNDVFNFPRKGAFYRKILENNLSRADYILSTSRFMADETCKYTSKPVEVLPFGIDIDFFSPAKSSNREIVIGTVKSMEHKYGMMELMKAFHMVSIRHSDIPMKLLLVGRGSLIGELKALADELNISDITEITGFINYSRVPEYHNKLDISVFPSTEDSETFGVSVLEASACGKPVIVSNIGGLPEVIENNKTGILINPKSIPELAEAIEKLVLSKQLREEYGSAGRERVVSKFNFDDNLNTMVNIYKKVLK
jgi:L-malate glycosyltransferase